MSKYRICQCSYPQLEVEMPIMMADFFVIQRTPMSQLLWWVVDWDSVISTLARSCHMVHCCWVHRAPSMTWNSHQVRSNSALFIGTSGLVENWKVSLENYLTGIDIVKLHSNMNVFSGSCCTWDWHWSMVRFHLNANLFKLSVSCWNIGGGSFL